MNELNIGENILNNPQEIAEGFNEYFSNIGPDLASKIVCPIAILRHMLKNLNPNSLHSSLKLLIISLAYCVDYQAIKQLELIRCKWYVNLDRKLFLLILKKHLTPLITIFS